MRFAWRTETTVLPEHKITITEQSLDFLPREKLRALVVKLTLFLEKT